jgi:hypothetical protein
MRWRIAMGFVGWTGNQKIRCIPLTLALFSACGGPF